MPIQNYIKNCELKKSLDPTVEEEHRIMFDDGRISNFAGPLGSSSFFLIRFHKFLGEIDPNSDPTIYCSDVAVTY